jgi:hypothetical protein
LPPESNAEEIDEIAPASHDQFEPAVAVIDPVRKT